MKRLLLAMAVGMSVAVPAAEFASSQDAITLVGRARQHIKEVGRQQAYADFTARKPDYVDRDAYVVVYDFNGVVLAHGQKPEMVGKDMLHHRDADGKSYVWERVGLAKEKPSFWQDYKFLDPVSKEVLPKSTYCERDGDDTVVCVGIYKRS